MLHSFIYYAVIEKTFSNIQYEYLLFYFEVELKECLHRLLQL